MEEEGREIIKHARSLSMSSLSAWSNGEELTPPRYEPIARMHDSEDTALIAAWEHGLQEAREREANRRGEAQQPVRQRWRQVAIKVAKLKTDAKVSAKIAREARVLEHISTESQKTRNTAPGGAFAGASDAPGQTWCLPCPRFFEAGNHQGRSFVCMELLGPSLKQLARAEGNTLNAQVAYAIGARIALNLFKIHSCGWAHGNVSPEDILVGRGEDCGNLYLAGFAHAVSLQPKDYSQSNRRDTEKTLSCGPYADVHRMQTNQATKVGDLWSLFYVLLECLTGSLPWLAMTSPKDVLAAKMDCARHPERYSKSPNAAEAAMAPLPKGLAAFHEALLTLDFGIEAAPVQQEGGLGSLPPGSPTPKPSINAFSYYTVVNKLLNEAGEKPIADPPASLPAQKLEQIQWPVRTASELTELSKMAGSKSRSQETLQTFTMAAGGVNGSQNGAQQAGTYASKVQAGASGGSAEDGSTITRKGSGMLSGLVQTLSACLAPPSVFAGPNSEASDAKEALNAVLDEPEVTEDVDMDGSGAPAGAVLDKGDKTQIDLIAEGFYREQKARVEAEVQAKDKDQRLKVAHTQLIEYASQQARDALQMKAQGEIVLSTATDDSSRTLLGMITQHEVEASAFHKQQCADFEKSNKATTAPGPVDDPIGSDPSLQAQALEEEEMVRDLTTSDDGQVTTSAEDYAERAKYIPLRLSLADRRLLRLLEAALNVSEYTDRVDVLSYRSKHHRINQQLRDMCSILCGLVVAQNYKKGKALIEDKDFKDNASFFQSVFEIGRRHKILNPEKMRTEYGKLLYMLMDSQISEVQSLLEFKCVRPLQTVHSLLSEKGAERVLSDPLIKTATEEIRDDGRRRQDIQKDIKKKERAREMLASKYATRQISKDEILTCLYSIGDNNSYLLYNRDPIDKMIQLLTKHFRPKEYEADFSLAITGGVDGARLSHSHTRQYTFVLQSLTLWREISHDMYKLWYLAEKDILSERNRYALADTGQGLNRIQRAPLVYNAVTGIISRCQRKIGSWVGSSVVHLGDHNVPNALMFIDKYTQVPRILSPIVLVIEAIPELERKDRAIGKYFRDAFGGSENLIKTILADFFRHAFDGSGADNFFDAGSCIDGRLTSAWNWSSKIEKKPYFPVFRLAGFSSFDGEF